MGWRHSKEVKNKNYTPSQLLKISGRIFDTYSISMKYPDKLIYIELKKNNFNENERIEYLNVSFADRTINMVKRLKVYNSVRGMFVNIFGERHYIDDFIVNYY